MCHRLVIIVHSLILFTSIAHAETRFTYQGELMEAGQPAGGLYNMVFTIWDDSDGGTEVASDIAISNVPVSDGRFTVDLDFDLEAYEDGENRWLQIEVNGHTLAPRHRLTATPYSINTRGITVSDGGSVGIGTTNPLDQLHVAGDAPKIRLQNVVDPGGWTELQDVFDHHFRMAKYSDHTATMDFDPVPLNGSSLAEIRFFKETNTTGTRQIKLLRGDGSSSVSTRLGVDGLDTYFGMHGGSIGIGTVAPQQQFHATGTGLFGDRLGVGDPDFLFGQLTISDPGTGAVFALDAIWDHDDFPTAHLSNAGSGGILHLDGSNDVEPEDGGVMVIGNTTGLNMAMDRNEIMVRNNGAVSTLYLNNDGGTISMGQHGIHPALAYGKINHNGTVVSASANVTTVSHPSTGEYGIHLSGGVQAGDIVIVTPYLNGYTFSAATDGGFISVLTRFDGSPSNTRFSFVVYRP